MNSTRRSPSSGSERACLFWKMAMPTTSHVGCFPPSCCSAIFSPLRATTKVLLLLDRLLQDRKRRCPRTYLRVAQNKEAYPEQCSYLLPHKDRQLDPHKIFQRTLGARTHKFIRKTTLRTPLPMDNQPNQRTLEFSNLIENGQPWFSRHIRLLNSGTEQPRTTVHQLYELTPAPNLSQQDI
jgi:hypothetical protein